MLCPRQTEFSRSPKLIKVTKKKKGTKVTTYVLTPQWGFDAQDDRGRHFMKSISLFVFLNIQAAMTRLQVL